MPARAHNTYLHILQAPLDLQLQFVRALREQTTAEEFVPISFSEDVWEEDAGEERDEEEQEWKEEEEGEEGEEQK